MWGVAPAVAVIVAAVTIAFHASLQHEVLHGHPTGRRALDEALVWPALGLAIPFDRYRDTHLAHHRDAVLTDPYDDPESNYLDPAVWSRLPAWLRAVLRVNNTLAGRLVFGPVVSQWRFVAGDWRAAWAGDRRVIGGWARHLPAAGVVLAWVWVAPMPGWAYALAVYGGLSLQRIRSFLEHQAHDRASGRTAIVEDRGPLALLFLNNNLHVVHHMHPGVAWYRLPALYRARRERYVARNGGYVLGSYGEVFRRYLLASQGPGRAPALASGLDAGRAACDGGAMEPWVLAAVAAALFQTGRFALQKRLTGGGLTATGATYARFVWSAPLAALGVLLWSGATGRGLPAMPWAFWGYASLGGVAQVLATVATVRLFSLRHFAVGITLSKTEVILTAAVGFALLGDRLTPGALAALLLGVAGLLVLAPPPRDLGRGLLGGGAALGLLAGLLFAVSAVSVRGAALALPEGGTPLRAGLTLAVVTGLQAAGMTAWLLWRDRGEIGAVVRRWRETGPVGLASALGSFCWFTAFALQSAALVKAVGQVELIASLAVGRVFFGESPGLRELAGIALLAASILWIVGLA